MTSKTLVVKPNTIAADDAKARIKKRFLQFDLEAPIIFMSHTAGPWTLDGQDAEPVNPFAVGETQFRDIYIVREFPLLYAAEFTLGWLDALLTRATAEARLHIEILDPANKQIGSRLTPEYLRRYAPDYLFQLEKGWLTLTNQGPQKAPIRKTIYGHVWNQLDAFRALFDQSYNRESRFTILGQGIAERALFFSLYGTWQKGALYGSIFKKRFGDQPLRILDMGGGYGFLGAELACLGHRVTVADCDKLKLKTVGEWLVHRCGVEDRLDLKVIRNEDIASVVGKYDVISFIQSLCYTERATLPHVIRSAMNRLNPGGLLLINEIPRDQAKEDREDYDVMLTSQELSRLLLENAGEPTFYNLFSFQETSLERAATSATIASVPASTT